MLNDYLLSVILGIVEGLTEFLPVSSTAHLRLAQLLATNYHLTSINMNAPYWKMYTIVIQLGAILCLPVYFMPRILKFLSTYPRGERGDRNFITHPLGLTMVAFVVTAAPTFFLTKKIGEHLENFKVIGASLLIGGIVMWIVDYIYGRREQQMPQEETNAGFDAVTAAILEQRDWSAEKRSTTLASSRNTSHGFHTTSHMEDVNLLQAIWVGAWQILSAVFPGTSRSMSTIAAGQISGMTRATALEFSFFVSIPTMFAATLFTLKKAMFPKAGAAADAFSPKSMSHHDWIVLAIGFAVSFVVALGVVAWFMAWVRRRGFTPFAIYRIVLGAGVLYWAMTHTG